MDTSGFLVFWQPLKPCGPIVHSHMIISYFACWLGALEDLNMAITLSNGTGSVACQAYTQRGLIYRLEGIYILPYDIVMEYTIHWIFFDKPSYLLNCFR